MIVPFLHCEAEETVHGNPNAWAMGMITFGSEDSPWHGGNEMHWRMDSWIEPQQLLIRPFIGYKLYQELDLSLGYTLVKTYPYGEFPLPSTVTEHNIWEQILFKGKIADVTHSHRWRVEHRWIEALGNQAVDEIDYILRHRLRYRFTLIYPLEKGLYLSAWDELFLHLDGQSVSPYDRNWFYAGMGYKNDEGLDLQLGYLHQSIQNNSERWEINPGLQLSAFYHIDI